MQIENRADATAVLGAELVAQAKPDGHTFYISDNSFYQNPAVLPKVPYDTLKDFTGVTMFAQGPVVLITHPSVPAKTLKRADRSSPRRPTSPTRPEASALRPTWSA